MQWSSWSQFFLMGGYGRYVWGSYGVTFFLLGAEVIMLLKRRKLPGKHTPPTVAEARDLELETQ